MASVRLWHGFLLLGVIATAIYFSSTGLVQAISYELLGAFAAAAVIVGIRRYHPHHAGLWYLVATGLGLLIGADVILNLYENWLKELPPYPSIADAFFLLGNLAVVTGLARIVRHRAPVGDHGSFIDAAIIAVGAGVLSWTFLMVPYAKDETLTLAQRLVSMAYPLIDVLLLATLSRLLFINSARTASFYLLTLAVCATMIGDVAFAELQLQGTYHRGHPIDAFWMVWYACWGAAALHPSMRTLTEQGVGRPATLTGRRLLILSGAAILVPAVGLIQWARSEPVDLPVIAAFSALLFILVLIRMNGLVRTVESSRLRLERAVERERTLRGVAAALGGTTDQQMIQSVTIYAASKLAGEGAISRIVTSQGDVTGAHPEHGTIERLARTAAFSIDALPAKPAALITARKTALVTHADWPALWQVCGYEVSTQPVLITPLYVAADVWGLIVVMTQGEPSEGVADGLEALASQVSLALERAALADDLLVRKSEERFRTLVRNASDMILVVAPDGTMSYVSPSVERVLGFRPDALIHLPIDRLIHADERERWHAFHTDLASETGTTAAIEFRTQHRDGTWRRIEAVGTNLLDDPTVKGIVINARDITDRKLAEEQLAFQAFHDPLTGLPNRARFMDRLEHALTRSSRRQEGIAVLFMDLDRFKVINDSLGHESGDQLLIAAGQRLAGSVRDADTAARLGGDEFTVLLENVTDSGDAIGAAERILSRFKQPLQVNGRDVHVTVSIGIALSQIEHSRPSDLLRDADIAMYRAKRRGGGGYAIFDADMGSAAIERLELETDLRQAIDQNQFRVYFQPEVELATGRILCHEALVRWQHPKRGLVAPAEFIPLAEETGLIIPIGRWVLAEACRQTVEWGHRFGVAAPTISVNLSVRQFQHPGIIDDVATVLRETGLAPQRLTLEITETVIMEDAESNNTTLQRFRDLGVKLAIDDFGSGYSSLGYLKRFPVDILKIDRAFVAGLGRDLEDTAIVKAISSLAETLNMQVVAEGVETREQVTQLRLLGCNLGQGYYFARPMTADDAEAELEHQASRQLARAQLLEIA